MFLIRKEQGMKEVDESTIDKAVRKILELPPEIGIQVRTWAADFEIQVSAYAKDMERYNHDIAILTSWFKPPKPGLGHAVAALRKVIRPDASDAIQAELARLRKEGNFQFRVHKEEKVLW
jgi:hypothetical protein